MKLSKASGLEVNLYLASKSALQERRKRFPTPHILLVFLVFAVLFSFPQGAETTMITTNIIHRTFHIRWNDSTGTGFTVDRGPNSISLRLGMSFMGLNRAMPSTSTMTMNGNPWLSTSWESAKVMWM